MATPAAFRREGAAARLQAAATEGGLARVRLEGGGARFAGPYVFKLAGGRIVEVLEPAISASRLLELIALAPSGALERWGGPEAAGASGLPVLTGFAEAERAAARAREAVEELGGLAAAPRAHHARLMSAPELPEAAARVVRLADGERTIAEILAESPTAIELSARILARLGRDGLLVAVASAGAPTTSAAPVDRPPRPADPRTPGVEAGAPAPEAPGDAPSGLPRPEEMRGAAVESDLRRWLGGAEAPESLLSDEAFSSAFTGEAGAASPAAARVRAGVPFETRRPPRGPEDEEDDDDGRLLAEAGVGGRPRWGWLAFLLLAALAGLLVLARGPGEPTPPPSPSPEAGPALTATTSSVASSSVAVAAVEAPDPAPAPTRRRRPAPARRRIIRADPQGSPLERAKALIEAGDPEAAEQLLDELRTRRRRDPAVWQLSAQAAVDLGQHDSALRRAQRAIALAPRAFEGWVVKGSALQFAGRLGGAIDAYGRALELDPEHPRAGEVRAVIAGLRARGGSGDP